MNQESNATLFSKVDLNIGGGGRYPRQVRRRRKPAIAEAEIWLLQPGKTYDLYIDGVKKVEVTLKNGMNTIGDDGGEFTGGYHRGTW